MSHRTASAPSFPVTLGTALSGLALGVLALAILLLPATSTLAQPQGDGFLPESHRGGHQGGLAENLAEYLELTPQQIEAVQQIRADARAAAEPLRDQQRAQREQLRELLDIDSPDATAVGEAVISSHELRGELATLGENAKADVQALLTAEQLERWENLSEVRDTFGGRGDRGPGNRGPRNRGPRGGAGGPGGAGAGG